MGQKRLRTTGPSDMCKIGYVVWQWDILFEGERSVNSEENRESYDESKMWRETETSPAASDENTDELMNVLGLWETVENLSKASRVWWYGYVEERWGPKKGFEFQGSGSENAGTTTRRHGCDEQKGDWRDCVAEGRRLQSSNMANCSKASHVWKELNLVSLV